MRALLARAIWHGSFFLFRDPLAPVVRCCHRARQRLERRLRDLAQRIGGDGWRP